MSAARMFAPKVAAAMGQTSAKVARPVIRSSIKSTSSQRAFSGKFPNNRYQAIESSLKLQLHG